MTHFDPLVFRQMFPALSHSGIYLDSAATALKPQALLDATLAYYGHHSGSVHRGHYAIANESTAQYEQARYCVARFINAKRSEEIIWTKGATESLNLVAQGYAANVLRAGDEIIVSEMEHHANLIPWLIVAKQTGAHVVKLPLGANYAPTSEHLKQVISPRSKILAISQMSNVTGAQPNLNELIALAHAHNITVVVDGAQGVVHQPTDVQALDADFYAFSAHKLYGPTGVGVLYGKTDKLAAIPYWQGGGKMLTHASFNAFTAAALPYRLEAGTPNIAGVLGFKAVLEWLSKIDNYQAQAYTEALCHEAYQALAAIPGFKGYKAAHSTLFSFTISPYHPSDLITLLGEQNIALRSGQHCAEPMINALGVNGTLRVSFAPYNSRDDVEKLTHALHLAISLLED